MNWKREDAICCIEQLLLFFIYFIFNIVCPLSYFQSVLVTVDISVNLFIFIFIMDFFFVCVCVSLHCEQMVCICCTSSWREKDKCL